MSDEVLDQDEKQEETPEQKASKVEKQYNSEMKFIADVLGGEGKLNPPKVLDGDKVAVAVARMFKDREEKLAAETFVALQNLVDVHLACEADIKKKEEELKKLKLEKRKEFTKVAKAWRAKINQQDVQKQEYKTALETAIKESNEKKD